MTHYCVLILLALFSANLLAAPPSGNVPQDLQDVYVYRPSVLASWARTIVISVNGIASAELASCSFTKLKLPSGVYSVDAAIKPWPFDRSTESTTITVSIPPDRTTYIGYYPNELSATEISATFFSHPKVRQGSHHHFFGVAYPDVASKEMVSCSAVKSLHE